MEFIDYIWDNIGKIASLLAIIGSIYFFVKWLFKPKPSLQKPSDDEPIATAKITTKNYNSETNEPERTDEEKRIILISKLEELEDQLSVFKRVLHKTRISSINAEHPHK